MSPTKPTAVSLDGIEPTREQVKAARLTIDPRIQRPLDSVWVATKLREYSPAALGTFTLSERRTGVLVVLDGQHRAELVRRAKDGARVLDAHVFRDLTIQQEAEIFRRLNDNRRLTPLVKYRIAVVEGAKIESACDKILRENGLQAEEGHPNSFRAVRALVGLYETDPVACAVTIGFLATAWGKVKKDALDARLVAGFGRFFSRHGDVVHQGQLAAKLQKNGTPANLIGEASVLAKLRGVKVPDAVADKLVNIYNKGRQDDNKLPDWSS